MSVRSLVKTIAKPAAWALGFNRPESFISIFRQCMLTPGVSQEFLESHTAKLVNPQQRLIRNDTVSLSFPASTFRGFSDENLLALFTKGFFGGWVFYLESLALRAGVWRLSPVTFTGRFKAFQMIISDTHRIQVLMTASSRGTSGLRPTSQK